MHLHAHSAAPGASEETYSAPLGAFVQGVQPVGFSLVHREKVSPTGQTVWVQVPQTLLVSSEHPRISNPPSSGGRHSAQGKHCRRDPSQNSSSPHREQSEAEVEELLLVLGLSGGQDSQRVAPTAVLHSAAAGVALEGHTHPAYPLGWPMKRIRGDEAVGQAKRSVTTLADEYFPGGQAAQEASPGPEKYPSLQGMHPTNPSADPSNPPKLLQVQSEANEDPGRLVGTNACPFEGISKTLRPCCVVVVWGSKFFLVRSQPREKETSSYFRSEHPAGSNPFSRFFCV